MTSTMSGPEASPRRAAAGHPGPRFLEDKLQIPQPSFPVLRRRRLCALLDQGTRHRVTLVCGPAGAGKTVACASWAAASPVTRRVVWLTVDAGDQKSWFWSYLCAGLKRVRAAPADALSSLEDSSADSFPLGLVEVAQQFTEPVVLVLDDVHELIDPAVLKGLDLLIRHAPAGLHLVLSARRPPALQLARLRVSGELADIGPSDLACTAEEADAYFAMLGIDVATAERDELLGHTEGWMAGLRLASLHAEATPEAGGKVTGLAGGEPMVTDYLWDEVLGRQEPEIRTFLLRTSIATAVSGDLADALTGQSGSARTLDRLSRENSFVEPLDPGRREYRYHPLLREVLEAQLRRELPHEIPVLQRRAARWYAAHGRAIDAVRCAAQAEDWDYAAQALADAGAGAVMSQGPAALEAVLALFPADRIADDAAVAAAWAAARLWSGDPEGAAVHLDSGNRSLERAVPAMRRILEPTLAALRIMHAASRTDPDPGLVAAGRALAEQAQVTATAQPEHRALGLLWLAVGVCELRRWGFRDARRALGHADRQLGAGGLTTLRARARAWRALAEAWHGNLAAAQRAAEDVLGPASGPASGAAAGLFAAAGPGAIQVAQLARAQVSLDRDDLAAAAACLAAAEANRGGQFPGEPSASAMASLIRSGLLLADGDATAARALLSRLRESWGPSHPALSEAVTVAQARAALRAGDNGRARGLLLLVPDGGISDRTGGWLARAGLLLAEGEFQAAAEAVEPALEDKDGNGTLRERIAALCVGAVARRRLGALENATDLLEQALALAEPEDFYRVILDGGGPVRSALTVLIPPTSRNAGFAGRILERFDAAGPRPAAGGPGQPAVRLTDSERAVLCFLPSHMTNEEISQALFLSINTVKTHLRSAYRKLGVGSRREAIARGRRLGLLLSPWMPERWRGQALLATGAGAAAAGRRAA